MKFKTLIKKFTFDPNLSWEDNFNVLEEHHIDEVALLVKEIERLENNEKVTNCASPPARGIC
jgi:hypothetical protein